MIENIANHSEASAALQRFLMMHGAALPEFTREKVILAAGSPSPVDRYVETVEALYAAKNAIAKEARDLAIPLARFIAREGWHGMQDRGPRIADALSRIGGYAAPDGQAWSPAEDDVDPLPTYVEPSEVDAPIAPPLPGEPVP